MRRNVAEFGGERKRKMQNYFITICSYREFPENIGMFAGGTLCTCIIATPTMEAIDAVVLWLLPSTRTEHESGKQ